MHENRQQALARRLERYRPLVDDWPALLETLERPLPLCVWTNRERVEVRGLEELLRAEGFEPRPLGWRPGAFRVERERGLGTRWWYLAGLAHCQEEASLLPVAVLDPRPGERVLDLCAAPGGKTAMIALALGNRGTVVANDVQADRIRALRGTLDRLGLVNVTVTRADGCNYPREAGRFDKVLVDAPCSAEGTLRKRAWLGSTGPAASRECAGRQRALLRKAVQLCRPGGRIVYSTCTFAPEENEAVVDATLRECAADDLRVVAVELPGLITGGGVDRWNGTRFDPGVRCALRLWPQHNDTGGFFVALLDKRGGTARDDPAPPRLEPAADDEWRPAVDRFGIAPETWRRYVVFRRRVSGLHIADRDHAPPRLEAAEGTGLHFMKTRLTYPKLSTAATLVLAPHATRNVVDLDPGQSREYMARRRVSLTSAQRGRCTDTGYVIVTRHGFGLGIALFDATSGSLGSMFPKRWHGGPGVG